MKKLTNKRSGYNEFMMVDDLLIAISENNASKISDLMDAGADCWMLAKVETISKSGRKGWEYEKPLNLAWQTNKLKAYKAMFYFATNHEVYKNHLPSMCLPLLSSEKGRIFFKRLLKEINVNIQSIKTKHGQNLLHVFFDQMISQTPKFSPEEYFKAVKFLIKNKVQINEQDNQLKTPLHYFRAHPRLNRIYPKLINFLMKSDLDLNLQNHYGQSVMSSLIYTNLPVKVLKGLINHSNTKVGIDEFHASFGRESESMSLINVMIKKGVLKPYKMLEYVAPGKITFYQYDNLVSQIRFNLTFREALTSNRLRDFLDKVFGYHSPALTNLFLTEQKNLYKNNKDGDMVASFINAGILFKKILVERKNVNYAFDLLKVESNRLICSYMYETEDEVVENLMKVFSPQQIKALFDSADFKDYDVEAKGSPNEILAHDLENMNYMFEKHCDKLMEIIKKQKFNNINTFTKLSNFISQESERLSQSNIKLEEIHHFPALKALEDTVIEGHKIIIPKNSYELISWGAELRNCVGNGSYAREASIGNIFLLGLEKDGNIQYLINVDSSKIRENEGKSKRPIPKPLYKKITAILKKAKLLR